jgi:hypothetical protein
MTVRIQSAVYILYLYEGPRAPYSVLPTELQRDLKIELNIKWGGEDVRDFATRVRSTSSKKNFNILGGWLGVRCHAFIA